VQHLAGFQIALQARQHQRPAAADALERLAAGLELVVDDRELDLILLRLKLEGDARRRFGFHAGMRRTKRVGEPPGRIEFEHRAGDVLVFTFQLERERRADLPVRHHAVADPVLLRHLLVGQRREHLLGRRGDIDHIDEFRFTHRFSPTAVSIH
jgi:hypothetical protein